MPSLTLRDPGESDSQEANEGALTVSRKTAGHCWMVTSRGQQSPEPSPAANRLREQVPTEGVQFVQTLF